MHCNDTVLKGKRKRHYSTGINDSDNNGLLWTIGTIPSEEEKKKKKKLTSSQHHQRQTSEERRRKKMQDHYKFCHRNK